MKLLPLFFVLITFLLLSCTENHSSTPSIPEEQFINLYADLLILREVGILSRADSIRIKHRTDSLFSSYHVTIEQVEGTLQQYKKDLPAWKQFYEKVIKRLEMLQQKSPPNAGN